MVVLIIIEPSCSHKVLTSTSKLGKKGGSRELKRREFKQWQRKGKEVLSS